MSATGWLSAISACAPKPKVMHKYKFTFEVCLDYWIYISGFSLSRILLGANKAKDHQEAARESKKTVMVKKTAQRLKDAWAFFYHVAGTVDLSRFLEGNSRSPSLQGNLSFANSLEYFFGKELRVCSQTWIAPPVGAVYFTAALSVFKAYIIQDWL